MISKQRVDYYLIALVGLFLTVIAFKWNHLNTPYFWDEAWVYAPAVQTMDKTGLSLLPSGLPTDLSRGHPLLFHFLATLWVKIFGTDFISVHSFALFISLVLLLAVYSFASYFFSPIVGFASALLLAVQPVFLAQSSLLLPEIMLALWTILAFYAYLRNKKIAFVVLSVLMLMTKESGLVFLVALLCWELVDLILQYIKSGSTKVSYMKFLLPVIPIAIASLFFIIQKVQFGWFFYPTHINEIKFSFTEIFDKIMSFSYFVFERQGRYLLIFMVLVCHLFYFKLMTFFEKIILFSGYAFLSISFITGNFFANSIALAVIFTLLIIIVFRKNYLDFDRNYQSLKIISIIIIFVSGYFLFSALNVFFMRYLFIVFPFVIIACVYLLYSSLENIKWIFLLVIVISSIFCIRAVNYDEVARDYSLSYLNSVHVQKKMIDYLVENKFQHSNIFANWLTVQYLIIPYSGYIDDDEIFPHADFTVTNDMEYCIFTNVEMNVNYDSLIMYMRLEPIITFQENSTWIDLYKFNGFDKDTTALGPEELSVRNARRLKYREL